MPRQAAKLVEVTFVLDADKPVCVLASTAAEARHAIRGLRSVGFLEPTGYVLGGGPVRMKEKTVPTLGAATLVDESEVNVRSDGDAELLLTDVLLVGEPSP